VVIEPSLKKQRKIRQLHPEVEFIPIVGRQLLFPVNDN
jgi:hypothetical protein